MKGLVASLPPGFRIQSTYREINALLEKNDLEAAREKLERAGVGNSPDVDALKDKDVAAARRAFEDYVSERFVVENRQQLSEGKPRIATEKLSQALRYCPWCLRLQAANTDTSAIVARLDLFGRKVRVASETTPQDPSDLTDHRAILTESSKHRPMLMDSPAIQSDLDRVATRVAALWEARIRRREFTDAEMSLFRADLTLLGVPVDGQARLEAQLALIQIEPSKIVRERTQRDAVLRLIRARPPSYPSSVGSLRQLVASQAGSHVLSGLRQELLSPNVEYFAIAFAEELLSASRDRAQTLHEIVARSHLGRADRLAGSGRAAALALVHLERAQRLGLTSADIDERKVRDTAIASFAAAGRWPIRLRVETNPAGEPLLQDLARFAVTRSITKRARPHVEIQTVSRYEKNSDLQVLIESVNLLVPSIADLQPVTSTYLSHYEDVPNPAKSALKAQLNIQRISVDYALSSLNSAVTAFNFNPTQWTLAAMNSARTRYNLEIDTHNLVVQQYNMTSATVPRAVYLPYLFREGTVRHGWRVSGSVKVGDVEERFSVEEVDSDFVRIGTKLEDKDVSRRRDDFLDIPVGTERLVQQLVVVADRVHDAVAKAARGLAIIARPDLSDPERQLLASTLYPFVGSRPKLDSALSWAQQPIEKLVLPSITDRPIPARNISRPRSRPHDASPEEIASFYAPAVALVVSKDGAAGSGALISGDGLVLTAAHVVRAEPIEVAFPRSNDARRRLAKVVFVNEAHDVALIQVTEYRGDRWFEIALTERAAAGEAVVALGNPSVGGGAAAIGAVSSGIVAKPYEPDRSEGLPDLVANVAVASGSSGGPLVSPRSGKIVGVVTAVVSPSISKDFATSGYWAVAAPGSELGKWLGVEYPR